MIFLILSPFYSLCFLIPSQYFSTVSLHFSTIFKYCECFFPWNYFSVKKNPIFFTETSECIFPWNYFSVKKNPIFFTETSECIFPWNYFSNFHRIWISTSVWDLESSAVKFSLLIKKIASNFEDSIPSGNWTRIAGLEVSYTCHCTIKGWMKWRAQIYEFKSLDF